MRAILYSLIFLLFVALASSYSSVFIKGELKEGETAIYQTDSGIYALNVVMVSDKKQEAIFKLNYEEETPGLKDDKGHGFKDGSEVIVRDVLVDMQNDDSVKFFFYGTGKGIIEAELPSDFVIEDCNFDKKCEDETKDACCYDCGCNDGYICVKNRCVRTVGCTSDEDCDDQDPCTDDLCKDDKCSYEGVSGCILGNKCLDEGTTQDVEGKLSFCLNNEWSEQKTSGQECGKDYECLNGICKNDKCYKPTSKSALIFIFLIVIVALIILLNRRYKLIKKIKKKLFFKF